METKTYVESVSLTMQHLQASMVVKALLPAPALDMQVLDLSMASMKAL